MLWVLFRVVVVVVVDVAVSVLVPAVVVRFPCFHSLLTRAASSLCCSVAYTVNTN